MLEAIGSTRPTGDGRMFIYAKAGATALAAGKLAMSPAAVANHINLSCAATAIGKEAVTVTLGATAATANQYAGGFLQVNDGTGQGIQYPIIGHPAADASATLKVRIADPIKVALVASGTSQVSLIANPVIATVETDTEESHPVGVAPVAVTAAHYYWAQVRGLANVLVAGTPAVGTMLVPGSVAGAVAAMNATLDIDQPIVGRMAMTAGVDTEYKPVTLTIM